MRYFVTGASGWIGSALVPELLGAGHQVVGLARSDQAAADIAGAGAEVLRGDVQDVDVLRAGASDSDGVLHLAFRHDVAFTGDFPAAVASDRAALEAMGDVLAGSDRPLIMTSGLAGMRDGVVLSEHDFADASESNGARSDNERYALSLADRGVRSASVRLAPTVHGRGDNGFMTMVVAKARESGFSAYVGDGDNRWPAVHRLDAARLFRLAVENVPAGTVLHGVAEVGVPLREIAEVIGRGLDLPVRSVSREDAGEHFGWLATFLGGDIPASSEITRRLLDWQPTQLELLPDLAQNYV